MPNPKSLAYKKAKILGSAFGKRWLKFISGYRNDSEKDFSPKDLRSIIKFLPNYKFEDIRTIYVGSYLLRSTSKFIIKCSESVNFIFKKYKFMYLISAKKL